MLIWLFAITAGAALAVVQYRFGGAARATAPRALRAVALSIVLALLLDAPGGPARRLRPYAALDASASWLSSGDTTLWKRAVRSVDSVNADTVLLMGDSVRAGAPPAAPADRTTRVAPLVERALGAGRAAVFVTDGRVDDPERIADLPSGSRVVTLEGTSRLDAAVVSVEGPAATVVGDTAEFSVVIAGGGAGSHAGRISLVQGTTTLVSAPVDSLSPYAERTVGLRTQVGGSPGPRLLRLVLSTDGDALAANDTLSFALDVARGASAVFASTAPDEDARYALDVLRGTLAVPTRGFFRVAPGRWVQDGSLVAVTEDDVRRSMAEAPLAVLHGDTAIFGAPRAFTRGALALVAPPAQRGDDFYAVGAPPSPLLAGLGGLPWDSLPPVDAGVAPRDVEWVAVTARRARRMDERPLVSGSSKPRRVVVVAAAGLWRWKFRGGRSADAFTALWGSIFDWLTAETTDARAAHPATAWVRAGEPVRWRRGSARDSAAVVVIRAVDGKLADTLHLRFAGETGMADSRPLAAGVYETRTAGGDGLLAVNASAEWLPRPPTVHSGAAGSAPAVDRAPRARALWWLYALALSSLCAEWVMRRRVGLR
ncbi:MAG TPA: hypothetical protein VF368_10545 [Gemmatimonadaceae bacterium]